MNNKTYKSSENQWVIFKMYFENIFICFKETNFRGAYSIKILKGWIKIWFCQFTINLKKYFFQEIYYQLNFNS